MNPLVLTAAQILLQYGPGVYASFIELAHHPNPTKDDFLALGKLVSQESYDQIIAERRAERGLLPVAPTSTTV